VAIQRQRLLHHFAEKQRIQRDLNIARTIQQGLLPRSNPVLAGFDIAGWNRPADETGGDFFDCALSRLPGNLCGVQRRARHTGEKLVGASSGASRLC
jgi:hypothetical protein